ncbi:MAG TPA: lipopolysaccharide transport periplasmic protein LptA [Gammaproteobacteria bacterium]
MGTSHVIATVLLLVAATATGSEADAPLTVEAASMEADRGKEISVFTGNVRVDKGSIHIEADEVRLRAHEGEVQEGTLIGAPVKFRQQPDDAPLVEGEARRIEYDAVNRVVVLTGGAWVRQGTDEVRGETIRYDLDGRKVLATSSETAPERVKLVFRPKEETRD